MTPAQKQARMTAALDKARAQIAKSPHAQALRVLLLSPAGKDLMAWLRRSFADGDLVGDTPEQTYFNLGAREVVVTLERLSKLNERTTHEDPA